MSTATKPIRLKLVITADLMDLYQDMLAMFERVLLTGHPKAARRVASLQLTAR